MTQRTGGQGRGIGGMSGRAAAWLAWSLVVLSVVLLVGGLSFALMTRSSVPERPYYGLVTLSVLALAFSVVGAIIASHQPRDAIGWIFGGVGVTIGFSSFAGDYAEFWLASGFGRGVLGETAAWFASWSWTLLVYLPTSFLLLLFPDGGLHACAGITRRLPPDNEPLRCRQPYTGGGCGRRCHPGFSFHGGFRHLAHSQDAPGGEGTAPADQVARLRGRARRWRRLRGRGHLRLDWGGGLRPHQHRPARGADLHGSRDHEVPPLRDRHRHKSHPRLWCSDGCTGRGVLRRRGHAPGSLPRLHWPRAATPTRHRRLYPCDRGPVRSPKT